MMADVVAPSSAGRTVASSNGDSIRVTLMARNSLICMGMLDRERPGATIMHVPTRQKTRNDGQDGDRHARDQEIAPSDLTSTPRAISTWESIGNVGNIRSVIMRT